MKTKLLIILSLTLVIHVYAGSATWDLDPASANWNNATNWTPDTVPNGPSDVATFSVSNRTDVSIAASVEVSEVDFTAGASAFNISAPPGVTLTISGPGVSNASGIKQRFTASDNNSAAGAIIFLNSATAGDGNTYINRGDTFGFGGYASTEFFGTSNAGTSTIINTDAGESFKGGGVTEFFDQSSAANSTIINQVDLTGNILDAFGTSTCFYDNSTAGNAILIAKGNTAAFGDDGAGIDFLDQSTADHATITIEGGGPEAGGVAGGISFGGNSTAADASITMLGAAAGGNDPARGGFSDSATAGNATIVLENGEGAGAFIYFYNTSSGGQAAFTLNGTAFIDITQHSAPGMAVGSLAGDGIVHLGSLALTIGTNNQNTEFAGTIEDTGHTGSLVKTGTGSLTLSGENTYRGGTTVSGGALLANNATGSATGTGPITVNNLAILGGNGTVTGAVTIASGGTLAPAAGPNRESTFTTQSALTLASGSKLSYTAQGRGRNVTTDRVVANGVTISGATFVARVSFAAMLRPGVVLTVIDNTSSSPIAGTFANLPDQSTFTAGGQNFQASYEGGDGNDLTLTVAP